MFPFSMKTVLWNMDPISQHDPDMRVMALNDLSREISKDQFKFQPDQEPIVIDKLIYILQNDTMTEVRSFALKCLPPLCKLIMDESAVSMMTRLSTLFFDQETASELRHLVASSIKVLIENLPISSIQLSLNPFLQLLLCNIHPSDHNQLTLLGQPELVSKYIEFEIMQLNLDLLQDLILRSQLLSSYQLQHIQDAILPLLSNPSLSNQKKSIHCLNLLSQVSSEDTFIQLFSTILSNLEQPPKDKISQSSLLILSSLCRTAGYRIFYNRSYISSIVRIVIRCWEQEQEQDNIEDFQQSIEILEHSYQCLESLIRQSSPQAIQPHLDAILNMVLSYFSNNLFNYEVDYEVDYEEEEEEDDEEEDDDQFWKVRRIASVCLGSMIRFHPSRLILIRLAPILVFHFMDDNESVQNEILSAFDILLLQLDKLHFFAGHDHELNSLWPCAAMKLVQISRSRRTADTVRRSSIQNLINLINFLPTSISIHEWHHQVIEFSLNLFSSNHTSSSLDLELIKLLSKLVPFQVSSFKNMKVIPNWTQLIQHLLSNTNCNIVSEVLNLTSKWISTLASNWDPDDSWIQMEGYDQIKTMVQTIYHMVEAWSKPSVMEVQIRMAAIHANSMLISDMHLFLDPSLIQLTIQLLLQRMDQTQDHLMVERIVMAFGRILSTQPSLKIESNLVAQWVQSLLNQFNQPAQKSILIQTFLVLVSNRYLELVATKLKDKLIQDLAKLVQEEEDMMLVNTTLKLIQIMLDLSHSEVMEECIPLAIERWFLPIMLNNILSSWQEGSTLSVILGLVRSMNQCGYPPLGTDRLVQLIYQWLSDAPLTQDEKYLKRRANMGIADREEGWTRIPQPSSLTSTNYNVLAAMVAIMLIQYEKSTIQMKLDKWIQVAVGDNQSINSQNSDNQSINGQNSDNQTINSQTINSQTLTNQIPPFPTDPGHIPPASNQIFAIFVLGHIGKRISLDPLLANKIHTTLLSLLLQDEEILKLASSTSLGNLLVSNYIHLWHPTLSFWKHYPYQSLLLTAISQFLTMISSPPDQLNPTSLSKTLKQIREVDRSMAMSRKRYDRLDANQMLLPWTMSDPASILPFQSPLDLSLGDELVTLLLDGRKWEENITPLVAETLGKLALLQPEKLDHLLQLHGSSSAFHIILLSLKIAITSKSQPRHEEIIDRTIHDLVEKGLDKKRQSVQVRVTAMTTIHYMIHQKSKIISPHLDKILPIIYNQTEIESELIKVVDMGPFKYRVDEGISLRQAAYECIYTIYEIYLDQLEMKQLISIIIRGLGDSCYDIKILNQLILSKIAVHHLEDLEEQIELILAEMENILNIKVKENTVKHDRDRVEELRQSTIRTIANIIKSSQKQKVQGIQAREGIQVKGGWLGENQSFQRIINEIKQGPLGRSYSQIIQQVMASPLS